MVVSPSTAALSTTRALQLEQSKGHLLHSPT